VDITPREAAEELARRKLAAAAHGETRKALLAELYPSQRAIVEDPSRNKGILGTRRSGKTNTWHRYAPADALTGPRRIVRVWASTRLRCKELMMVDLKLVCQRHRIPFELNETELRFTFENGSEIRLVGADKDKDAQKKRGDKTSLEIILEAQGFGPFLQSLVEDVVEPSLFDLRGTICMEGTPGIIPAGYWYAVSGQEDVATRWESQGTMVGNTLVGSGWSCHRLSVLSNPFIPHASVELAALKARRHWDDANPTYLREWCAKWVLDLGALFYRWREGRNTYDLKQVQPWGPGWSHVLGWDIGFNDAMALVVWGWHPNDEHLYEAFSWQASPKSDEEFQGQPISEVINGKIKELDARFNIVAKVADTGGGGRLFVEEVQSRFGHVFQPAQKTEKYAHVTLMNDDFITGRIKTLPGSAYSVDVARLPVDQSWEASSGRPPTEDPSMPNHTCFVAGTKVLTYRGEVPIERVMVGDFVYTRKGWRRVVAAWATGLKPVITRLGLTGTPEHPIFTQRGWVRLDEVRTTDVVLCAWTTRESSYGMESSGTGTLSPSAAPTACTSSAQGREVAPSGFIEPSGKCIEVASRRSTTFTTKTKTLSITLLRTLSAFLGASTFPGMGKNAGPTTQRGSGGALRQLGRWLLSGIGPKKVEPGIESTGPASWPLDPNTTVPARYVGKPSEARIRRLLSAGAVAMLESGELVGLTTRLVAAVSADRSSSSTSTASSESAPGSVQTVYALSVDDQHEYFANGILVSNCDAGLYSWRYAYNYLSVAAEKPKTPEEEVDAAFLEKLQKEKDNPWWETEYEPDDDSGLAGDY